MIIFTLLSNLSLITKITEKKNRHFTIIVVGSCFFSLYLLLASFALAVLNFYSSSSLALVCVQKITLFGHKLFIIDKVGNSVFYR